MPRSDMKDVLILSFEFYQPWFSMELFKPSKDKEVIIWGRLRTRTSKQGACVKKFCRHMCVFV